MNIHRIILINLTYSKSIVSSTYKCVLCQYSTTNVHPSKWPPPMHASTLGSQKTHQTGTQANESHDSISMSPFGITGIDGTPNFTHTEVKKVLVVANTAPPYLQDI